VKMAAGNRMAASVASLFARFWVNGFWLFLALCFMIPLIPAVARIVPAGRQNHMKPTRTGATFHSAKARNGKKNNVVNTSPEAVMELRNMELARLLLEGCISNPIVPAAKEAIPPQKRTMRMLVEMLSRSCLECT